MGVSYTNTGRKEHRLRYVYEEYISSVKIISNWK